MYLITFHSNFDANMFNKKMTPFGTLKRKPVPRELSSSCGTCFEFNPNIENSIIEMDKLKYEAIYKIENGKYIKIKECE